MCLMGVVGLIIDNIYHIFTRIVISVIRTGKFILDKLPYLLYFTLKRLVEMFL